MTLRLSKSASRRCDLNLTPLQKSCVSSLAKPCHDPDDRQTHEQQIKNLRSLGTRKPNVLNPKIEGTMQKVHEEARLAELRENRGRFQIPTSAHDVLVSEYRESASSSSVVRVSADHRDCGMALPESLYRIFATT